MIRLVMFDDFMIRVKELSSGKLFFRNMTVLEFFDICFWT